MTGTIRTFLPEVQDAIEDRVRQTALRIAESAGARAEVRIERGYPVTVNDPALTAKMIPSLERVAGADGVVVASQVTGAEDFSYFAQEVPGLYFFLGITPLDQDPDTAPRNHSPYFFADEGALPVGVRALASLAVDYMTAN